MERKHVDAILSDYDGTLCPTTSVRGGNSYDAGMIPKELEQILFRIFGLLIALTKLLKALPWSSFDCD